MTTVEVHAIRGYSIWTVAIYLPELTREISFRWLIRSPTPDEED